MEYKRILTGSREYFTNSNGDYDYIIVKDQEKKFEHIREDNTCYFNYKKMTKQEYLDWQNKENTWYLNFSSLLNKEFVDYMGIDIFNKDKEIVYSIIQKAFKHNFLIPIDNKFNKYFYKMYIYYRYIKNGSFNLSQTELDIALGIKNGYFPSEEIFIDLFDFYGFKEKVLKLIKNNAVEFKFLGIEELENWFKWFDTQVIQSSWQIDYKPSYDSIMDKTYLDFDEIKIQANVNRQRIKELRKVLE